MKDFRKRIIVLNDKKRCVLLQTEYNNSNYFYVVDVNADETNFGTNYEILEGKEENGETFFRKVTDRDTLKEVSEKLYEENKG